MRALIIDDNPTNVNLLRLLISRIDNCEALCFTDPVAAVAQLPSLDFDIALVDYVMPELNGLQVTRAIRSEPRHLHVPIVIITSTEERDLRIETIEAGANDFLAKPVDPIEFKARVRNMLELRKAQLALHERAGMLQDEVNMAMRALAKREEEIVWRLSRATEGRDTDTGHHIMRMSSICRILAEEIGLEPDLCRAIQVASQMHDVGKVAIPDQILFKPGPLDPEERRIMQLHTSIGQEILSGSESQLIRLAEQIAASHHEHWNGKGYPRGLAGTDIPVVGRIAAVADVFDALVSVRPYKRAWPIEDAYRLIISEAGRQFDPAVVDAFARRFKEIEQIGVQAQVEDAGKSSNCDPMTMVSGFVAA